MWQIHTLNDKSERYYKTLTSLCKCENLSIGYIRNKLYKHKKDQVIVKGQRITKIQFNG